MPSTEALNERTSWSISLADSSRVNTWSSSVLCESIASTTGASLTGRTVRVNVSCTDKKPSLAMTVTSPTPFWSKTKLSVKILSETDVSRNYV